MREESLRLLEGKDILYCGAARKKVLLYAEIPGSAASASTAINSLDKGLDVIFGIRGEMVPPDTRYLLGEVDICCTLDLSKKPECYSPDTEARNAMKRFLFDKKVKSVAESKRIGTRSNGGMSTYFIE